jgi:hypothetical protein
VPPSRVYAPVADASASAALVELVPPLGGAPLGRAPLGGLPLGGALTPLVDALFVVAVIVLSADGVVTGESVFGVLAVWVVGMIETVVVVGVVAAAGTQAASNKTKIMSE